MRHCIPILCALVTACAFGIDSYPSFDAVRTDVLARRALWLEKAEAARPRLFHRKVLPVTLVKTVSDASAFQGWRVEPAGAVGDMFDKPLVDGDSFILDFGEHLVGAFSFKLTDVRCVDAPIRLGFTFAEVPLELAEEFDVTTGSGRVGISRAWVQKDVVTIDDVPAEIRLSRRYAFRYVKVDVQGCSKGKCRFADVHAVAQSSADETALKPWIAPSPEMAKIESVARRTLRDCMQTVFEDGPKRDRRLWLGDLRLEALANYATYRNFDVVKRSLYLLAGFADDNGMVHSDAYERPVPRRGNSRIFDYVALFTPTVLEYLEASGDRETAEDLWTLCFLQLDFLLPAIDSDGVFRGLKVRHLLLGGEKRGWCVKDRCSCKDHCPWCFIDHCPPLNRQTAEQGVLAFSFRALMRLGKALGKYEDVAFLDEVVRRMERGANEKLWDEGRGLYVCEGDGQASYLGQAWLVLGGLADGDRAARCMEAVFADAKAVRPATPYGHHYFIDALQAAGLRREADEHLKAYWGRMVELGADTFWEVFVPEDHRASPYGTPLLNSYCHAWSCAPAYFLRRRSAEAHPTARHSLRAEDWALQIAGQSMWFSTAESSPGKMLMLFSSPWEADVSRDGSGRVTLTYSYSHPDHPDWAWTKKLSFIPTDADEMECEFFETRANRPGGDVRAKGVAKRIPPLPPAPDLGKLTFGEPVDLLADGLDGWETIGDRKSLWTFKDGVLENGGSGGADIRTKRGDFTDFRLSYDVRADKGCNSGVYLRGIYEIQTIDSYGKAPDSHNMGAVYGRVAPSVTVDRPSGEWQHVDVTLCDRHATVVLNGVKIIDNAPLRGITGGALSPDQFAPGPIMIQGSHNGGAYRNMVLTPIVECNARCNGVGPRGSSVSGR